MELLQVVEKMMNEKLFICYKRNYNLLEKL
jgi:hypothetical protein